MDNQMVNGSGKAAMNCLAEATLQARHFADPLGLFKSRLHTWLKVSGLEPSSRQAGETRLFSPFDVLTITTLWWLKRATDVAFVRHPDLIACLSDRRNYGEYVLTLWEAGLTPIFITDFRASHLVVAIEHLDLSLPELLKSDVTTIVKLPPIVDFALQSVRLGGSNEQKALVEAKLNKRTLSLSHVENDERGPSPRPQLAFFDVDRRKRNVMPE